MAFGTCCGQFPELSPLSTRFGHRPKPTHCKHSETEFLRWVPRSTRLPRAHRRRMRLSYREVPQIDGDRAAERSKEVRGRLAGLMMALLLSPIYFLLVYFTNENRGFVVFCVLLVFAAIVYVLRKKALRARLLFPILLLFAVELSVALLAPLPAKMPGFIMISIGTGDLVLLSWILSLFDRTLREDDDEGPRYSG